MFKDLNNEQKEAVKYIEGPLRIIAGPGTGKTNTLIHKMAYLIDNGYAYPNEILAITFTNKAAAELRNRLGTQILSDKLPNIYTYHGFSSYFLRVEAVEAGIDRNYIILDITDQ
jgi:DNA helicase-2/ATP-dependent DNA helicase PcrA